MDERRRAVGADQLDAAIEKKIAEERGKDADEGKAGQAFGVENRTVARGDFDENRRSKQEGAPAHADGKERQRVYGGPLAQIGRIEAVSRKGDQQADIAAIELNPEKHGEAAVADDDKDAGQRDADAAGLAQCQAVAKQRETEHRDEQR